MIEDSAFMNHHGSALTISLSNIKFVRTLFERNHAACKMNCVGGALYTKYSSVLVCNSTFYSNKLIHFGDLKPVTLLMVV